MGQFDQELDPETGAPILMPAPILDPLALLALSPPTPTPAPAAAPGPMPMPMGPLGPRAASIPLPIAPSAPPPPGALQHIIASALLGLAAGLGPRSAVGRGLSGGLEQNAEQARLAREQAFKDQQLQYHQQQEELLRQAQIGELVRKNEEARSIQRAKTLDTIAKTVPSFETKDEYDRFIDQTGNLLVNSGFRDLSPVMLRSQFP